MRGKPPPGRPLPDVADAQGVVSTVSRETLVRLESFCALLLKWNSRINLISRTDEAHIWQRHVQDSLALIPLLPPNPSHAIDIGTGGGFPGLVLAIATGLHFHLVESDHRKSAFLREAARATATTVILHPCRIEDAKIPAAPVITARALAPLPRLLAWSVPHLTADGVCLFPKGRTVDHELALAQTDWQMRVERFPSPIDPSSTILRLSEIARVGH